ncbi:hypothetical protein MKEN_01495000 [Mycena kentingensis (nom. inval.)]|nr:hypothetical protein MKEN_01495000 [Mycena kentingensis (nom. inval.)]
MPITISVAKHKANAVAEKPADLTTREIFAKACKPQLNAVNGGSLLGSSFPTERTQRSEDLLVNSNGFFQTLVKAYNEHHALVLRPDDVWHAILVQFNFYINANAEVLRAMFVEHDGTKELVVKRQKVHDVGEFARAMVGEIEKNVVDPTLREWALPDFSTTTECDTTISSVLLMATLKGYFRYMFRLTGCGIPRVTLEGEREDWAKLLQRAEKFKEYGLECVAWHHMLVGVLSRFVRTFDEPDAASTIDFWYLVADHQRGSGMDHYSGWVSAFCVWDQKGTWVGPMLKRNVESTSAPESLSAKEFWATYYGREYPISREYQQQNDRGGGRLVLDNTPYEAVDRQAVPICYTEVDVLLVNETTRPQS